MPRLFTPDEVREELIPYRTEFSKAKRAWVRFLKKDPQVAFAMFYGSSAVNKIRIESDSDIFIIYKGETAHFMDRLRKFTQRHLRNHFVPIELVVYKTDHIGKGLHGLSEEFFYTLEPYRAKGVIKSNDVILTTKLMGLAYMGPETKGLGGFLATKHSGRFKEYPFLNPDVNDKVFMKYMQKLVQTQSHFIRNILYYTGNLPSKVLTTGDLFQVYIDSFGPDIITRYDFLLEEQRRMFSHVRDFYHKGEDFDERKYQKSVSQVFEQTPYYLSFIEDILDESNVVSRLLH